MFSTSQKREISEKIQQILCDTNHPELPTGEIAFHIHIFGESAMSWADIENNGAVIVPDVTQRNEQ